MKDNDKFGFKKVDCKINSKEGDNMTTVSMPAVEDVEYSTTEYIKGMQAYVKQLSSMPKDKLRKHSKRSLVESGIIDENGNFTEQYRYSDINYKGDNE